MAEEKFTLNNMEDLFAVSRRKQAGHKMLKSHFHSSYEAYYLLSGKRQFFIKDRTIVAGLGDLIILHPDVLHRTANAEPAEHEKIILNFKEEFLPAFKGKFFETLNSLFQEDYLVIHFTGSNKMLLEDFLLQIVKEAREQRQGYDIYIQTLVAQVLLFASRYLEEHEKKPLEYLNPMHERISEIVRYINENYKKSLSLQYVADKFYISPSYLSKAFKEVAGFGFTEYVNSIRIKEAKKLLEETTIKVHIIAERVGYGSITHFGRVFKEITGHTPLYYRKRKS